MEWEPYLVLIVNLAACVEIVNQQKLPETLRYSAKRIRSFTINF